MAAPMTRLQLWVVVVAGSVSIFFISALLVGEPDYFWFFLGIFMMVPYLLVSAVVSAVLGVRAVKNRFGVDGALSGIDLIVPFFIYALSAGVFPVGSVLIEVVTGRPAYWGFPVNYFAMSAVPLIVHVAIVAASFLFTRRRRVQQ